MFNPVTITKTDKITAVRVLGLLVYARVDMIARAFGGAYWRVDRQRAVFGVKLQKPRMPSWMHL